MRDELLTREVVEPWRKRAPGAYKRWAESHPSRWYRQQLKPLADALVLRELPPAVGRAHFPVVCPDGVHPGFVLTVEATDAGPIPLPETVRDMVRHWIARLVAVEPETVALPPLSVIDPAGRVTLTGRSGELAAAVAALSHLLQRPPSEAALVSGCLDPTSSEAGLEEVSSVPDKAAVCAREAPGIVPRLVDEPRSARDWLANWFGETWRRDLLQVLEVSPLGLAESAKGSFAHQDLAAAERTAEVVVETSVQGRPRGLALWIRGAVRMHRAEADALPDLLEAKRLLGEHRDPEDPPPEFEEQELTAYLGIALLDHGLPDVASGFLEESLEHLDDHRRDTSRWRKVALQVAGSLHRVRVALGDHQSAIRALTHYNLDTAALRAEKPRNLGDLAEVYRRAGQPDKARAALREARQALRHAPRAEAPRHARYHRLWAVRLGETRAEDAEYDVAPPDWTAWPQPAEAIEALLAREPEALLAWFEEHELQHDLRFPQALVYALALARHLERGGQAPAWLAEYIGRLTDWPMDLPVREALEALGRCEPELWLRRCPY